MDRQAALSFFSSRRRYTRYIGDWSSDVCSSDLKWLDDASPYYPKEGGSRLRCSHVDRVRGRSRAVWNNMVMHHPATSPSIHSNLRGGTTRQKIGRASCRERVERWEREGGE